MKLTAVVSEKGQVTIPKPLRRGLGIRAGTELRFEERDGALVARRVESADPIEPLIGLGGRRGDVDAILGEMRGPAWNRKVDGRR